MVRRWQDWLLRGEERLEELALGDARRFRRAVARLDEERLLRQGRQRAELAAWRAWQQVPAYRDFLAQHGVKTPDLPFARLPVMSKDRYVRAYPTEQRCVGGSYLAPGVAIDESSGSTGIPYNWVRGIEERRRMRRELARMLEWAFGERPRIAINAFSMGAWATGVNMGEALELHGVVKSTGPDLEKILHTLTFFGPGPGYFLCGYPPFLKLVLDEMRRREFPLEQYELHALVGGEGMSEELRRYLLQQFRSCYSGYGASDLEMGIAIETPESIAIRSLLHDDPELRAAILEGDHRVPMVFQYNPARHYLEVDADGALIVTLNHSRLLSPRIRYNIGDEARLSTRRDLLQQLAERGHPVEVPERERLPFPYLFLFGRRDQTISIMGANIYPEDIERAIFTLSELASGFASFHVSVEERGDGAVYPRLSLEWISETPPELPLPVLAGRLQEELAAINSDFRNARKEYAAALELELRVYGFGQGPFAGRGRRIKNRYLGANA
jgi:phenylacetate-CoA ligase